MRSSSRQKSSHAHLIEQAQKLVGKGRQEDLAAAMGVRQQIVSKLMYGDTPLTAALAIAIHRATKGAVSASLLCPDLADCPELLALPPASPENLAAPVSA